jgi:non-ribosomal peptide synthetase component F
MVIAKPGGHADSGAAQGLLFSSGSRVNILQLIPSPRPALSPDYVMELVSRHKVTYVDTVPVLGREYFKSPLAKECCSLRLVVMGGEVLPPDLVTLVHSATCAPDMVLMNCYGPTEATVEVTRLKCLPGAPVTLGAPDSNTHTWIVDQGLHLVPMGVAGELVLR